MNAAASVQKTIRALPPGLAGEVVVSDGGSKDETVSLAVAAGARVVEGPAGRGRQLARGALAARGDWLLFLHADTRLGAGAGAEISAFVADPDNQYRAGAFRYRLDDQGVPARILEAMVRLRCRVMALPYGDQGLLISRGFYDALGGFRPLALMEDVDLIRRIGRARLHFFTSPAITSAVRYRRDGYLRRTARNLCCLIAYFLGVPPDRLREFYER